MDNLKVSTNIYDVPLGKKDKSSEVKGVLKIGKRAERFEKADVPSLYNLPDTVAFCKKCVMTNQRPRIVFDDEGVCNACHYWERKKKFIDWKSREKELQDLCDRFRRKDGRHDVLVPSSGGKDSAFIAHQLKYKYGMNPLTVTWAPSIYTDIGWKNFQGLVHAGLDNVLGTPNGLVHRRLTKLCTIDMGDPFQPFIYGQVHFPIRMAIAYDIPFVMDGENAEVEYGGDPSSENDKGYKFKDGDLDKYVFSNKPLEYWYDHGFTKQDLIHYTHPTDEEISKVDIERHYMTYYTDWRPQSNYYYCVENTGFQAKPDGRSEGTFSKYASLDDQIDPFHFYFMLLKFGVGRATSDAAHEVREDLITRDEAARLVRRYDTEFPSEKSLKIFLEYCNFTEEDFWNACERWRNLKLWERKGNDWVLKQQVQ